MSSRLLERDLLPLRENRGCICLVGEALKVDAADSLRWVLRGECGTLGSYSIKIL